MTMPDERTRALLWAGGFLVELAQNESLPLDVRRRAVAIARHFPTYEDVSTMARPFSLLGAELADPAAVDMANDLSSRLLRRSTRLAWPEPNPTQAL